jgi:nitrous oxide reductase accessory protein NosL
LSNRGDPDVTNAAVLTLLLLTASACAVTADGPPHVEVDRTPCAHCGMLVSEPVFAAAYRVPGADARVFDDIGCLLESVSREPAARAIRFWFHDANTQAWIDGSTAVFVHSDRLRTPMAGGLIAYAERASAERGARAHEGRVVGNLEAVIAERTSK